MIDVIFFENRKLTFALSSLAKKSTKNNLSTIRAQLPSFLVLLFSPPEGHPCPALGSPPAPYPNTLQGLLSVWSSELPALCPADRPTPGRGDSRWKGVLN